MSGLVFMFLGGELWVLVNEQVKFALLTFAPVMS